MIFSVARYISRIVALTSRSIPGDINGSAATGRRARAERRGPGRVVNDAIGVLANRVRKGA